MPGPDTESPTTLSNWSAPVLRPDRVTLTRIIMPRAAYHALFPEREGEVSLVRGFRGFPNCEIGRIAIVVSGMDEWWGRLEVLLFRGSTIELDGGYTLAVERQKGEFVFRLLLFEIILCIRRFYDQDLETGVLFPRELRGG